MPYIMKKRNDSKNLFEEKLPCVYFDEYINSKKAEGKEYDYMQLLIACIVRVIAEKPQLNRFIMNRKIFARKDIYVCFVVQPNMRIEGDETIIKLKFTGTETLDEIATIVADAVRKETVNRVEDNSTDKLAAAFCKAPGGFLKLAINFVMGLDNWNLLPKSILDASPFHTTVFLTNVKSLGISGIYHHLYEFGTNGLFVAMGKEQITPMVTKEGEIKPAKAMSVAVSADERFCDGMYFARSLKLLKRYIRNLSALETPLEKCAEDVR